MTIPTCLQVNQLLSKSFSVEATDETISQFAIDQNINWRHMQYQNFRKPPSPSICHIFAFFDVWTRFSCHCLASHIASCQSKKIKNMNSNNLSQLQYGFSLVLRQFIQLLGIKLGWIQLFNLFQLSAIIFVHHRVLCIYSLQRIRMANDFPRTQQICDVGFCVRTVTQVANQSKSN